MRTLKLTLAYDGTEYAGWQRQTDHPTIQALVEDALVDIEGHAVTLHGAGRTDAGVHALGQVASVRLTHPLETLQLGRALNAKLPSDIRILRVDEASDDFHARFSARGKTYRYRLTTGAAPSPFESRYVWALNQPIDVTSMRAAASQLCGRHDFAAFQTAASEGAPASTVRTISRLRVDTSATPEWLSAGDQPDRQVVTIEVSGDGFLRHMVRTIVGTLVEVGAGRRSTDDVGTVLGSRCRENAGQTAPASGLFLVSVDYP